MSQTQPVIFWTLLLSDAVQVHGTRSLAYVWRFNRCCNCAGSGSWHYSRQGVLAPYSFSCFVWQLVSRNWGLTSIRLDNLTGRCRCRSFPQRRYQACVLLVVWLVGHKSFGPRQSKGAQLDSSSDNMSRLFCDALVPYGSNRYTTVDFLSLQSLCVNRSLCWWEWHHTASCCALVWSIRIWYDLTPITLFSVRRIFNMISTLICVDWKLVLFW